MVLLLALLASAATAVDEIPPDDVLRLFDQQFFEYEVDETKKEYLYRLFRPAELESERRYPLVVWLHGYGDIEFNDIGFGHLKHTGAIFESADQAKKLDFYFLAVQCPIDQPGFFRNGGELPDGDVSEQVPEPGEIVMQIVDELVESESINASKVSLIGISGAGTACLEMAARRPAAYSGIAVFGSPGGYGVDLQLVSEIPVWAFHSRLDPDVGIAGIRKTVDVLEELGGSAHLTEIDSNMHNCWAVAFRDFDVLAWLLAQEKGALFAPPPGVTTDHWRYLWIGLVSVMTLVLLVALYKRARAVRAN